MHFRKFFEEVGLDPPDPCVQARMIRHYDYSKDRTWLDIPWLLSALLPLAYGGAHAARRNPHPPTKFERNLWRICAIIGTCYVPVGFLLAAVRGCVKEVVAEEILVVSAGFMILVGMPLLFCARLFFTIESFLSPRSLPQG